VSNPHPTNSKPCKIGRKHTGKPSLRTIGRRVSRGVAKNKVITKKFRQHKAEVAAFWKGEIEDHPKKP
jgi:hypothetical protein